MEDEGPSESGWVCPATDDPGPWSGSLSQFVGYLKQISWPQMVTALGEYFNKMSDFKDLDDAPEGVDERLQIFADAELLMVRVQLCLNRLIDFINFDPDATETPHAAKAKLGTGKAQEFRLGAVLKVAENAARFANSLYTFWAPIRWRHGVAKAKEYEEDVRKCTLSWFATLSRCCLVHWIARGQYAESKAFNSRDSYVYQTRPWAQYLNAGASQITEDATWCFFELRHGLLRVVHHTTFDPNKRQEDRYGAVSQDNDCKYTTRLDQPLCVASLTDTSTPVAQMTLQKIVMLLRFLCFEGRRKMKFTASVDRLVVNLWRRVSELYCDARARRDPAVINFPAAYEYDDSGEVVDHFNSNVFGKCEYMLTYLLQPIGAYAQAVRKYGDEINYLDAVNGVGLRWLTLDVMSTVTAGEVKKFEQYINSVWANDMARKSLGDYYRKGFHAHLILPVEYEEYVYDTPKLNRESRAVLENKRINDAAYSYMIAFPAVGSPHSRMIEHMLHESTRNILRRYKRELDEHPDPTTFEHQGASKKLSTLQGMTEGAIDTFLYFVCVTIYCAHNMSSSGCLLADGSILTAERLFGIDGMMVIMDGGASLIQGQTDVVLSDQIRNHVQAFQFNSQYYSPAASFDNDLPPPPVLVHSRGEYTVLSAREKAVFRSNDLLRALKTFLNFQHRQGLHVPAGLRFFLC
jgi:hypothetical protein